ncbi:MAG TPA: methionyl-tRNA formyltransferase, partial [bacterium]|nr:methionyl-tRNA formyltransferase [bacterium]
ELGIPVYTESAKSDEAYRIIKDFNPDIIFVVAYGQILPAHILSSAELYPLNVHFSLLPRYRGATPVNTAILNGDNETGTTIMIMDEGLDTGDVIFSEKCTVLPSDNATSLFEKLIRISIDVVEKNWGSICSGDVKRTPQTGVAVKTKLIKKEDLNLDFSKDALEIHNKIRAFNYSPGTKTMFRNTILMIERSEYVENCHGNPGEIIEVKKDCFNVCCGNGGIKILELKPAGKRSLKASEFINGYKPLTGEKLG